MVLCGLVLLLPCADAQDGVPSLPPSLGAQAANTASERPRTTLDQVVDAFSVEEVSLPDVLHYLFDRDHVIVGIELLAPVPEGETRSAPSHVIPFAAFGPAPVRDILDELVGLDPEFVWREDAGVANLVRRADLEDPAYVFNQVVEEFEMDDTPYDLAVTKILGITYHELGALPWDRPVRHRSEEGPRVTLRLRGATVRQITDEIAWQTGLAWEARLMRHRDGHQTMLFCTAARFGPPSPGCPGCPRGSIEPVASAPRPQAEVAEGAPAPSSTLLPLRERLAPHGFAFAWDPKARRVTASDGRTRLGVAANDLHAALNGLPLSLPAPPTLENGRLYVPAALVMLVLNAQDSHLASQPAS